MRARLSVDVRDNPGTLFVQTAPGVYGHETSRKAESEAVGRSVPDKRSRKGAGVPKCYIAWNNPLQRLGEYQVELADKVAERPGRSETLKTTIGVSRGLRAPSTSVPGSARSPRWWSTRRPL